MIALLILAMSSTVACDDSAMFDPVAVPFNDAPFASVRRACQRDEYSFGVNAPIIPRPKEFYGNIRLSGILSGSTTVLEDTELFAELEVIRYQQVIASLSASYLGLGHLALGATERALTGDGWELAATAHATLPTAIGLYSRTYPLALDAGATGTTRISDALELHAYAGGRGTIGVGAGPADPRAAVILDAGLAWRVASWFAFAVDLEGAAGERALLDHAALGLGMRFRAADGLRFDVALKAPVAGDERALASAYVGVAYWR